MLRPKGRHEHVRIVGGHILSLGSGASDPGQQSVRTTLVASPRWWDVGCVTEIPSWDSNGIQFFDLVRTKLTSTWFHPTRSNYGRSWILRPKNPESK